MRFEGVYPATLTPFDSTGKIDWEAYESQLERLAKAGVQGFVPCGTTGESPTLSHDETTKILKITRQVADKHKLKVIAGCGGNATIKVLEKVEIAKDLDCDAALVVNPYYNKPTPQGLREHFTTIATRAQFPVVLYNIPGRTGVNLGAKLIAELFEHEYIVGIKEATGDYSQWLEIAESAPLTKKSLMAGDDFAMAAILSLGGSGIISAAATVAPEIFVAIYNAAKKEQWKKAFDLQIKLNPLVRALFSETNPAPAKYAAKIRYGFPGDLRLPLVPVRSETEQRVAKELKALELLP